MKSTLLPALILILLLALTVTCSNEPTAVTYEPQTITVSMVDNQFQPPQITINKTDTVKWVNNGYIDHTSTSGKDGVPNGMWDSGTIHPGSNYSYTFDGIGTFQYYCSMHWQDGMAGIVTVVEP
jgi:plastocyanin